MIAPTIDNTFGAAFIGVTASSFVFGIFSMQCYSYYERYPSDHRFYKMLVGVLWLLEAAHSACACHFFYHYVIQNWGNLRIVAERIIWTMAVQVVLSAVVGTIVKICFAMRVWRFSGNNVWITGLIIFSTLTQFGFSVWFTIAGLRLQALGDLDEIFTVAIASLGLGVLTDIVTAAAISWYLRALKTGYKNSDTIVNMLIAYAINTGLLTSLFSIACLVTYGLLPNTFIFISLFFVLSKLYANSFLATLNTRLVLRGRGTDNAHQTVPTFLMVDTGTIPPLPETTSPDDVFGAAGKLEMLADSPSKPSYPRSFQVGVHKEVRIREDTPPRGTSRNTPAHAF